VRPSPGLVDVIEQLARQVHPEAFADAYEMRPSKFDVRTAFSAFVNPTAGCESCAR
jgi:hypothetical protein